MGSTRQARINATRDAATFLGALHQGDAVRVKVDGRSHDMTVSRAAHRADGAFGSWESTRVTVTLGPGRWSTEIGADHVAAGRQSIERLHTCAQCGETFTLPEGTTLTRGSRPCGWSH